MSLVPYNPDAAARMHSNSVGWIPEEGSEDTHEQSNLIHSLEDLLHRTREANEATKNRIPLEVFLADLKKKENKAEQVKARTIEIAAERIIGAIQAGVFGEHARLQMAVFSSQETQTENAMATSPPSQATQTDENSPYMQDLIKKVQREAFSAGFEAASTFMQKENIFEKRNGARPQEENEKKSVAVHQRMLEEKHAHMSEKESNTTSEKVKEQVPCEDEKMFERENENTVTKENGKISDEENEPAFERTEEQKLKKMNIDRVAYEKKPEKLVLPKMFGSDPFQSLLNLARHNRST